MPLPMVHLAVAREIARIRPEMDSPAFYLGALAPDAVHAREGASRTDKWASHLRTSTIPPAFSAAFLRVLPKELPGFPNALFPVGYAVHLLTDYAWHLDGMFWNTFYAQNPGAEEDKRWYYNDTDQADRALYDAVPWRDHVFSMLRAAAPESVSGLVTDREVALWRERVFAWFRDYSPARYRPARAISPGEELAFAGRTGEKIASFLPKGTDIFTI